MQTKKEFALMGWSDRRSLATYITHVLTELGRLNLIVEDIETYSNMATTNRVLSDLMVWLEERPGYQKLYDWKTFNLAHIAKRTVEYPDSKPRIEITAEVNQRGNFTARWYPAGWIETDNAQQFIHEGRFDNGSDFAEFSCDEKTAFGVRPTNELMYVRGVGGLSPAPRTFGPYIIYNKDVLNGTLLCALRAAYEAMIVELREFFDVSVKSCFDFVLIEQHREKRVVGWSLLQSKKHFSKNGN